MTLPLRVFARGPPLSALSKERQAVASHVHVIPHSSGLRIVSSASASRFRLGGAFALNARTRGRGRLQIVAVFERYTERAIKAVMLAQQEAKLLGSMEVPAFLGQQILNVHISGLGRTDNCGLGTEVIGMYLTT